MFSFRLTWMFKSKCINVLVRCTHHTTMPFFWMFIPPHQQSTYRCLEISCSIWFHLWLDEPMTCPSLINSSGIYRRIWHTFSSRFRQCSFLKNQSITKILSFLLRGFSLCWSSNENSLSSAPSTSVTCDFCHEWDTCFWRSRQACRNPTIIQPVSGVRSVFNKVCRLPWSLCWFPFLSEEELWGKNDSDTLRYSSRVKSTFLHLDHCWRKSRRWAVRRGETIDEWRADRSERESDTARWSSTEEISSTVERRGETNQRWSAAEEKCNASNWEEIIDEWSSDSSWSLSSIEIHFVVVRWFEWESPRSPWRESNTGRSPRRSVGTDETKERRLNTNLRRGRVLDDTNTNCLRRRRDRREEWREKCRRSEGNEEGARAVEGDIRERVTDIARARRRSEERTNFGRGRNSNRSRRNRSSVFSRSPRRETTEWTAIPCWSADIDRSSADKWFDIQDDRQVIDDEIERNEWRSRQKPPTMERRRAAESPASHNVRAVAEEDARN